MRSPAPPPAAPPPAQSGLNWEGIQEYGWGLSEGLGVDSLFKAETYQQAGAGLNFLVNDPKAALGVLGEEASARLSTAQAGLNFLASNPQAAGQVLWEEANNNIIQPSTRGFNYLVSNPSGALQTLQENPRDVGRVLGQALGILLEAKFDGPGGVGMLDDAGKADNLLPGAPARGPELPKVDGPPPPLRPDADDVLPPAVTVPPPPPRPGAGNALPPAVTVPPPPRRLDADSPTAPADSAALKDQPGGFTPEQHDQALAAVQDLEMVGAAMGLRTPVDKAVELDLLHSRLDPNSPPLPTDTLSLKEYVLQEAEQQAAAYGIDTPLYLHNLIDDLKAAGKSVDEIENVFDEHGLRIRTPEEIASGTLPSRPPVPRKAEIQQLEVQEALQGFDFPIDRRVRLDYLRDTKGALATDTKSLATSLKHEAELQAARYGIDTPPHLHTMVEELDKVLAGEASLEDVLAMYGMEDPRP
ncbi:hypothetical protein [Hyalangium sp.]|uniref:hypothetical protein n=1 Tax=Hyalangium sp. TaxID=2028555 RepID=UPI002D5C85CA|nr:hypothetical protein [Hyalangium sp.]HYI02686.1 hypothetical protein [Hyalangium sp.]